MHLRSPDSLTLTPSEYAVTASDMRLDQRVDLAGLLHLNTMWPAPSMISYLGALGAIGVGEAE